jgi:multisubunit Na+/H+ antiporter MnhB subunit
MKNYKLLPKIALIALSALGVVFALLFFLGGNLEEKHAVAGDLLDIPRFTDAFLTWIYILVGVAIVITLCAANADFVNNWKHNRNKAYAAIAVICGIVLMFVICWLLGSPKEISIVGYEGDENVGFWAQASDMVIYACYFLVAATIGAMIWGYVYTKRLK